MKKILLIEDDEILLDILQRKLKQEGYDISLARDGEDGLSKMKEDKPDLVLLDIIMPKKNGFEVLYEMQNDSTLSGVPVIIISNSGQPVEIDRAKQMGARDYIVKTHFDPAEVLTKVVEQLGKEEVKEDNF